MILKVPSNPKPSYDAMIYILGVVLYSGMIFPTNRWKILTVPIAIQETTVFPTDSWAVINLFIMNAVILQSKVWIFVLGHILGKWKCSCVWTIYLHSKKIFKSSYGLEGCSLFCHIAAKGAEEALKSEFPVGQVKVIIFFAERTMRSLLSVPRSMFSFQWDSTNFAFFKKKKKLNSPHSMADLHTDPLHLRKLWC